MYVRTCIYMYVFLSLLLYTAVLSSYVIVRLCTHTHTHTPYLLPIAVSICSPQHRSKFPLPQLLAQVNTLLLDGHHLIVVLARLLVRGRRGVPKSI